ncbi:MAG TPA: hypothetical protein VEM76_04585 [Anaeromyxobacteraceae bacterium]|jgi:hypothetical protein|nr:hypothetical protein [Anaeromyxobacteraceae bacterium]
MNGIVGVITGKDVLKNSLTIVRLWGPKCYLRCLRAALSSKPSTFLQVVWG